VKRPLLFFIVTVLPAAVAASDAPAAACPVCDTRPGQEVRDGIFDRDFGRNLLAVSLPFPLLLAVVGLIHFGWSPTRRLTRDSREKQVSHDD